MLVSDPKKVITTAGNLYKMEQKRMLLSKNITLSKNYLWDATEIDLSGVNIYILYLLHHVFCY